MCVVQLDLIVDLLGKPSLEDMTGMSEVAQKYVLKKDLKPRDPRCLDRLSHDQSLIHLLDRLLVFSPVSFINFFKSFKLCIVPYVAFSPVSCPFINYLFSYKLSLVM